MELIERIPLDRLEYLTTLTFADFKALELCKSSSKNDDERKQNYNYMISYCKGLIKGKGEMKRIYAYTDPTPLEVSGRLYSGLSIQGVSSKIRGFLMEGYTSDIDMKNAHPTILRYICKLHNYPCPNLEWYINNRDEILANFDNTGKIEFLKALNTDKTNKKIKDKFFKDFDKECKDIQQYITRLPEYKHITNSVPTNRNYNWLGSAINRILCVYENKILQEIINYITRNNIEIAALMFDGLMIYGNYYATKELLENIEKHIESKFEGLNMKLSYKAHKTGIINMPDDFKVVDVKKDDVIGVMNDKEAAEKLIELYPYWVSCNGTLYVFDENTGLWNNDEASYLNIISRFENELWKLNVDANGKKIKSNKSYGNDLTLMKKLPILIQSKTINNNWLKNNENSSLGKILFNNGWFDFKEKKFYSKTEYGFNSDILFFGKIQQDFDEFDDDELDYIDDVKNRLFTIPLGENLGKYFIINLARALSGEKMKRILFGLGGTDCGKSILTEAISNSLGDYVGTFNAEALAYRNSSADEASQMRWCKLLRYKRIIYSNEIKNTADLNGNMIKKISSGGDKVVGRGHGEKEEEFTTHFLAICMANDLPKIKPYDDAVDNRLRVISFEKQFVDEPNNQFELKKDYNLSQEIQTLKFKKAFVGLIIKTFIEEDIMFEPMEAIKSKNEWIETDSKNFINDFTNDYEITNNPDDYIQSCDIDDWIKNKNLGISMKKFGIEMNKWCALNGRDEVKSKDKKINGKNKKVWVGIKNSNDTDNC